MSFPDLEVPDQRDVDLRLVIRANRGAAQLGRSQRVRRSHHPDAGRRVEPVVESLSARELRVAVNVIAARIRDWLAWLGNPRPVAYPAADQAPRDSMIEPLLVWP